MVEDATAKRWPMVPRRIAADTGPRGCVAYSRPPFAAPDGATIGPMRWFDSHPFTNFIRTLQALLRDEAFRAGLTMLVGVLFTGTVFYMVVEGWSPLDSLYFAVIAAATVGFGDFAPQTELGKAFTIIYVLASVGLLVVILSRIAGGMIDRRMAESGEAPPRRRIRGRSRRAERQATAPERETTNADD